MSMTAQPKSAARGALIQIMEDEVLGVPIPNIVVFDINPETLSRKLTPFAPETPTSAPAPGGSVQPYDIPEEITGLKIVLDPIAREASSLIPPNAMSVEAKLAALRKMTKPSKGMLGDLASSYKDLVGQKDYEPKTPSVPIVLLWLGVRILLPVQIKEFSVEERQYNVNYYPILATVSLNLQVLTPDRFRCADMPGRDLAIAAYNYTHMLEDAAALLNMVDLTAPWDLIGGI